MDETQAPLPEDKSEINNEKISDKFPRSNNLSQLIDSNPFVRYAIYIVAGIIGMLIINGVAKFLSSNITPSTPVDLQATAEVLAEPTINAANLSEVELEVGAVIPPLNLTPQADYSIPRKAQPLTIIPSRERVNVITYEVKQGDNVFSIAEQYGLTPETILWGNYESLQDNFRYISVGQVFNILPVDGTYHYYLTGESLADIADQYFTTTDAIINYPGNYLDPYETDLANPAIPNGTWIIIPGGSRELADWGPPAITRDNPAVAAYYGGGSCGAVYEGAVGNQFYIWPTAASQITQGYSGVHPAIDIGGTEGVPVFAADSGVVVYNGWSTYGYGYLVVIDHGFGNQTAYAHLLGPGNAACGQSVYQGDTIGQLGNSGNSTGPHLHFEINSSQYGKVNPLLFIGP